MGLSPHFTGGEGTGEMNDGGSQWQKCSYTSGSYTLQYLDLAQHRHIHIPSRTSDGQIGEMV